MTEQDKEQLNLEISHIFESGANHLRIFEMVENFIDKRYKAINYTHCCKSDSEQLKDLEILSFEEWQEQNQELIRKSIGITGNEMAIELDLYTKYKTDQLLNL
jgi:hypothetical protein